MSEKYVQQVRRYYQEHRPQAVAELGTPASAEDYFRSLARQIEQQVQDAENQIAGPDPAGEGYLEKVGRLRAARAQAEELVLAELLYANPPEKQDSDEEEGFSPEATARYQALTQLQVTQTELAEELETQAQNPTR